MDAVSLLRQQYKGANDWLEGTMEGVEEALAHWAPSGKAHPIGANYAHILFAEDAFINGTLKGGAPLLFSTWADRTGLSEPQPMQWDWDAWAARVRVDVPATREYARAVQALAPEIDVEGITALNGISVVPAMEALFTQLLLPYFDKVLSVRTFAAPDTRK